MDNPIFAGNRNTAKIIRNDLACDGEYNNDRNNCNTADTSRIDETTFTALNAIDKQSTSNLRQRQKEKQEKLAAYYRYLNVTRDLDIINLS